MSTPSSKQTLTFPIRSDRLTMSVGIVSHVASVASPFQQIDIYDTEEFGRALLLDNHIQLATFDEAAYHESFVQVPLAALPEARRVLVVGGGDGGVLRELVKHERLEKITMVEIDDLVVSTCQRHLPEISNGAFDDPRVELLIEDAFAYVKHSMETFDLILVDATDVYEEEDGSLSENLFTQEFYADCAKRLSENGLVVTQGDNPVFCPYSAEPILDLYRDVFGNSGMYWCLVPSFGGYSAFVWGGKRESLPSSWPTGDHTHVAMSYLTPALYELGQGALPFGSLGS